MDFKENSKEIMIVLIASIILSLIVSFKNTGTLLFSFISFIIIISSNIISKKIGGYVFETDVRTKFWSWYQYGFRKDAHFKTPIPMAWLPLILALFSKGLFWWLAILEFDVSPKTERVSRKHGLYRFTQVTEWHMGVIAIIGIITNIVIGIFGYLIGFEMFAKLSIYYAMWSIIPISSLDGSKILFSSRGLWITIFLISLIFFGWGLAIA